LLVNYLIMFTDFINHVMSERRYTTIPVTEETREKVRSLKRGGISYDALVREMAAAYSSDSDGGH